VCASGSCQTIADCTQTPCVGKSYCDLGSKKCLPGCASNDQCPTAELCDLATHDCVCAPGHHRCNGVCVPETSISACGAACTVCPQDPNGQAACNAGQCSLTCNPGSHDCGGKCVPNDSPASCGSSCTPCPTDPNGTATCGGGQCGLTCNPGHHKCGSQCLSDTSPASCGTSCTPCPSKPGAVAACTSGACTYQCASGSTLDAPVDYATASTPKGIAIGDVTGDGKLDVVTAGSGEVAVHAGVGDGTFLPKVGYALSNGSAVAVGDITGDGRLDVIAGAGLSNTTLPPRGIWKLVQTASGTLSAAVQIQATTWVPEFAFLSDFSGDGKLDWALAFSSGIMAAAGNGNGTFGTPVSKSLGSSWAASGDVTGEGRPDLVLASYDKIHVVPGATSGVLGTEASTTVTYNYSYTLALGDFGTDGKADVALAATDSTASGMSVLTSTSGGALGAPATQSGGKGIPVVGDFNDDGRRDAAQLSGYYVYLRLSNSSGVLGAPTEIYSGASAVMGASADLDGDGFSDLVILSDATWNDEIVVMRSKCK
jgi:hypothetical protein